MVSCGFAGSWACPRPSSQDTLAKTPSSTQPIPDLDNRIAGSSCLVTRTELNRFRYTRDHSHSLTDPAAAVKHPVLLRCQE